MTIFVRYVVAVFYVPVDCEKTEKKGQSALTEILKVILTMLGQVCLDVKMYAGGAVEDSLTYF